MPGGGESPGCDQSVSLSRTPAGRGVFHAQWFREHGYEVLTLEESLYFEGAGDLLDFRTYGSADIANVGHPVVSS